MAALDKPGTWTYRLSLVRGPEVALDPSLASEPVRAFTGRSGKSVVKPTDKRARDLRARGRLQYVGKHHLRFAGRGEYFFKAGADAPETLLA